MVERNYNQVPVGDTHHPDGAVEDIVEDEAVPEQDVPESAASKQALVGNRKPGHADERISVDEAIGTYRRTLECVVGV